MSGFTLLELLVVISIIAILIGMISVSFTTAQQKSRNARRRADMKAVQSALEQYYAINSGSYPVGGCAVDQLTGGLPTDPKNADGFVYSFVCNDSATYCACAELEANETGNASDASCNGTTGSYFCVRNQQ